MICRFLKITWIEIVIPEAPDDLKRKSKVDA
jgi:hypothetical protein